MKKFITPSIEIMEFMTEDIIQTSSGTIVDGGTEGDFTGGGANAGWGTGKSNLLD